MNNKKLTHILFDVDGTLYDKRRAYNPGSGCIEDSHEFFRYNTYALLSSGFSLEETLNVVLDSYKTHVKERQILSNLERFSESYKRMFHNKVEQGGSNGNVFVNEFGASKDYFARLVGQIDFSSVLARDELLVELISGLKQKYHLGIITNEVYSTIEKVSSVLGFSINDFKMETGSEFHLFCKETGVSKPNLQSFSRPLELNNLLPEQAVYVGDSFSKDIKPVISLGMNAVHVTNNGSYVLDKTNYVEVGSIYDLSRVLL